MLLTATNIPYKISTILTLSSGQSFIVAKLVKSYVEKVTNPYSKAYKTSEI